MIHTIFCFIDIMSGRKHFMNQMIDATQENYYALWLTIASTGLVDWLLALMTFLCRSCFHHHYHDLSIFFFFSYICINHMWLSSFAGLALWLH